MSTISLVTHFRELSATARRLGLRAQLQFDSLRVEVCGADRYVELAPEFAMLGPLGPIEFSNEPLPQSRVFTGWRYAPRRSYDVSLDKRAFMAFCSRNMVPAPRTYARASEATTPVVVKQTRPGSRGIIRGPFGPGSIPADCLRTPDEVFLQEFVPGLMLQAWYWDGHLFAVEVRNRPHVVGDGVTGVRDLILCNSVRPEWIDWTAAEDAVRFQGEALDTVLPPGKELAVDIRFDSVLQPPASENAINTVIGTPIHAQLLRAGPLFCEALPEADRAHTQFVLGAIADSRQRLCFTDLITDLRIHPDVYDPMLRGLFGIPRLVPSVAASLAEMPAASPLAS
jgi:hypothetical protein